jgi:hypothetical protein
MSLSRSSSFRRPRTPPSDATAAVAFDGTASGILEPLARQAIDASHLSRSPARWHGACVTGSPDGESFPGARRKEDAMTHAIIRTDRSLCASFPGTAKRLFIAVALNVLCLSGNAQQPAPAPRTTAVVAPVRSLAEVEKVFWLCDHAASTYGVTDSGTATACATTTEDLKMRKFNGDFNAMLAWWKEHKTGQHAALDNAYAAALR